MHTVIQSNKNTDMLAVVVQADLRDNLLFDRTLLLLVCTCLGVVVLDPIFGSRMYNGFYLHDVFFDVFCASRVGFFFNIYSSLILGARIGPMYTLCVVVCMGLIYSLRVYMDNSK